MPSIMLGLSGGVDSAVALYLLKEQGFHVEAVFMKNWEEEDSAYCEAATDLADAQSVADQLKIKLHLVNFSEQYWQCVFAQFLEEHLAGRTPNPDILCNKEIKFRAFLDYAKNQGADFIATGHYARLKKDNAHTYLLKARDLSKDQTYFLHTLDEQQLASSLFPVGDLLKTEVRALAKHLGLKNYAKKDSTGICFIGERSFKKFLSEYLPKKQGAIETITGEIIGEHDGLMYYTIGQRKALMIGGQKGMPEAPWYVAKKDIQRNVLIVAQGHDHPSLFTKSLITTTVHWINTPPALPLKAMAKTRYRQADQVCLIESTDNERCQVTFQIPQRAITPGQSVVFYQDDQCLGGGVIACRDENR